MKFSYQSPSSPKDALRIQQDLREHVRIADDFGPVKIVAGIDVGYDIGTQTSKAAIVVMDFENLNVLSEHTSLDPTPFPYIPGLLSFREVPVILKALAQLPVTPDMLFVDGHGISHPRRLGIAAYIGVLTGLPAVGVAKSLLCGSYKEPGPEKGSAEPLLDKGETIGTVYRSRSHVRPIFIAPGHRIGHKSAVTLVERCLTRYRLPEPTRLADRLSKISATRQK